MIRGVEIGAEAEEFFRSRRVGAGGARLRMLALTYEFNLRAFERAFDNILQWPIRVDVITGAAEKSLRSEQRINSGLRIWRARWKGTFHPKLLLLLSKDEVMVGIGSANMTSAGLGERLETWRYFTAADSYELLAGIRSFLSLSIDRSIMPPEVNVNEFVEALPGPNTARLPLLSTLHGRLLDQVLDCVRGRVIRVDIVSPIEGNPAPVIEKLGHGLSGRPEFHLYSNEPVPLIQGISAYHKLVRPRSGSRGDADKLRILSTVHAKVFAFQSSTHVDVFWGSANLSQLAWLAQGKGANVDLLIHSRVSTHQWQKLRDGLPPEHKWGPVRPVRDLVIAEPRPPGGLQLLYATISKATVNVVATETGSETVGLRTGHGKVECKLTFEDNGQEVSATLSPESANVLGLLASPSPHFIDAKFPGAAWEKIPLNDLDRVPGDPDARNLEDLLLWEYAGRTFKRKKGVKGHTTSHEEDGTTSLDEEELAKFVYQGALDEFVLNWRVIAKRIALSSGSNPSLAEVRRRDTLDRIERDAAANPDKWPQYKREFVEHLLEHSCRA
jgi:hypothetical protein